MYTGVFIFVPGMRTEWWIKFLSIALSAIFAPFLFIGIVRGLSTVLFKEEGFVYKHNLFSRKRRFKYSEMTQIFADYCCDAGGRYAHTGPMIYVYFLGAPQSWFQSNMNYGVLYHLISNKPLRCKVKVRFRKLSDFSKMHRELLKDYMTVKQKDDIERLLKQQEERKKKKLERKQKEREKKHKK